MHPSALLGSIPSNSTLKGPKQFGASQSWRLVGLARSPAKLCQARSNQSDSGARSEPRNSLGVGHNLCRSSVLTPWSKTFLSHLGAMVTNTLLRCFEEEFRAVTWGICAHTHFWLVFCSACSYQYKVLCSGVLPCPRLL